MRAVVAKAIRRAVQSYPNILDEQKFSSPFKVPTLGGQSVWAVVPLTVRHPKGTRRAVYQLMKKAHKRHKQQ